MYAWAQKYGALTKSKLLCKLFFIYTVSKSIFITMIYNDFRNQSFSWQLLSKSTVTTYLSPTQTRRFLLKLHFFFTFITTSLQAKHLGYINFTENKLQKCYLQFTLIQNTAILSNYWMALSMISTDY